MKGLYPVIVAGMLTVVSAGAEEKKVPLEPATKTPAGSSAPAASKTPAPAGESEASKRWKAIKAQEEWVARLKKQIQGETNQLAEMRGALADAFKLDVKKLENGQYELDEKTGTFVEKKPA